MWKISVFGSVLDLRFKDLKCTSRAERTEVWASVTDLLKEQRVLAEKVGPVASSIRI